MSLIDESLKQWKSRLAEIDQQIAPLLAEADELRHAIANVEATRESAPAPSRPRSSLRRGRSRRASTGKTATSRAPRGANRTKILAAIATEPKTAGQVAEETGIGRGTVGTTLTKLARDGSAKKAAKGYVAA